MNQYQYNLQRFVIKTIPSYAESCALERRSYVFLTKEAHIMMFVI